MAMSDFGVLDRGLKELETGLFRGVYHTTLGGRYIMLFSGYIILLWGGGISHYFRGVSYYFGGEVYHTIFGVYHTILGSISHYASEALHTVPNPILAEGLGG